LLAVGCCHGLQRKQREKLGQVGFILTLIQSAIFCPHAALRMPLTRDEFLQSYFKELQASNIPFVLLHAYKDFPRNICSDVDYAVRVEDLSRLLPVARRVAKSGGWQLVHSIEPHIYSLYCVLVKADEPAQFVQLDSCGHYVEAGCFFFRDVQLLEGRVSAGGLFIPAPAAEFGYLLAKALAKGKELGPLIPQLRQLSERAPADCDRRWSDLFGSPPENLDVALTNLESTQDALRTRLLSRKRFGVADRLRESMRAVTRIAQPKGLHLGLLATASYDLEPLLARVGPMIQGPLFRSTKIRRMKNDHSFNDSTMAFLKEVLPAKVRNGLILSACASNERDAFDTVRPELRHVDLLFLITMGRNSEKAVEPPASATTPLILLDGNMPLEEMADLIYRRALDFLARREGAK
jgi:hypothetical protein